jgi:signal transduction histidine kinase
MSRETTDPFDVTPSARRLTTSLRDIGYDFVSALADVVDNSIAAGATEVDVEIVFDGPSSYVLLADNGRGMSEAELKGAILAVTDSA